MNVVTRESVSAEVPAAMPSNSTAGQKPLFTKLAAPPMIVIEPTGAWAALKLGEIWAYRELLYFLVWRDVKLRYKQTVLGVLWVIMQPLLMTIVFTIFLGKLARVPSGNTPYALLVYTGLLPWTFFSAGVTNAGNSLVGSSHLITKVYFPRMIIPLAAIGARLVDFAIAFVILGGMMVYYGATITPKLVMLPLFVLLLVFLALAIGMLSSAWNVKYRDVSVVLPVVVQLLMFISPIVYSLDLVPQRWRAIYSLNPLVGVISAFRVSLLGGNFNWSALLVSVVVTFGLLLYSAYTFRRMEKTFADIV